MTGDKNAIKKSVIFDLDGTLADTSGDLIAAANATLGLHGLAQTLEPRADRLTAFQGGRALLRLGATKGGSELSTEQAEALYPLFLEQYSAALCVATSLYPHARGAMETLLDRGYVLGVCTNKPEGLAIALIDQLDASHYFGAILGADSLPVRKPDPEHLFETIRRCGGSCGGSNDVNSTDNTPSILVGDTITDCDTARNAGVPFILFVDEASGIPLADDGQPISHDALMYDYAELPEIVARLLP